MECEERLRQLEELIRREESLIEAKKLTYSQSLVAVIMITESFVNTIQSDGGWNNNVFREIVGSDSTQRAKSSINCKVCSLMCD